MIKKTILITLGILCLIGCGTNKNAPSEEIKEDTTSEEIKEEVSSEETKEDATSEEAKEDTPSEEKEDDNEYGLINGGTYTAK